MFDLTYFPESRVRAGRGSAPTEVDATQSVLSWRSALQLNRGN